MLEVNALPSLERGASMFAAAAREGLDYDETLQADRRRARRARQGLVVEGRARRRAGPPSRCASASPSTSSASTRSSGNDAEAEYDAPETIDAIREALESHGHQVIQFEATAELPRQLMETPVDLVFNIAEGVAGRNREAAVPALCELHGHPLHGLRRRRRCRSRSTRRCPSACCMQHGILTAEFQVMETGRERLSPKLKFPLIVKPNQEGSSKGVQRVGVGRRRRRRRCGRSCASSSSDTSSPR